MLSMSYCRTTKASFKLWRLSPCTNISDCQLRYTKWSISARWNSSINSSRLHR